MSFRNATTDAAFTATQTGNYYFVVNSTLPSTFNLEFRLLDLITSPTLSLDTDTTSSFPTGLETVAYRFNGTTGQRILYDSLAGDGSVANLSLNGPGGKTALFVNSVNDSAPLTLTETGVYTLIFPGNATSPKTTQFRLLDLANVPTLAFGGQTNVTGVPQRCPFSSSTEQRASTFCWHATTISAGTSGNWVLYGPGNRQIATLSFVNDLSLDLPQSGQYVLVLQGTINTLSFESTVTPPAAVVPSGFDSEQTLTIAAGQQATYTFNAPAGHVFHMDGLANTFENLRVILTAPNGQNLAFTNDAADEGPFAAPAAGTYTVTLQGINATQTGDYRFRILDLTNAPVLTLGAARRAHCPRPPRPHSGFQPMRGSEFTTMG